MRHWLVAENAGILYLPFAKPAPDVARAVSVTKFRAIVMIMRTTGCRRDLRILVLASFALFTVLPFLPGVSSLMAATGLAIAFGALAWTWRNPAALITATLSAVWALSLLVGIRFPQLGLLIAVVVVAVLVRRMPWLAGSFLWIKAGRRDAATWTLGLAAIVAAAVGLTVWQLTVQPDYAAIHARFGFHHAGMPLLLAGAIVFALLNAAIEEAVYRGIVMDALQSVLRGYGAVALQALAFGLLHVWGVPGGWVGVSLATLYGALLGVVRYRAGGILVPWVVHVATDLVIFIILLFALD